VDFIFDIIKSTYKYKDGIMFKVLKLIGAVFFFLTYILMLIGKALIFISGIIFLSSRDKY